MDDLPGFWMLGLTMYVFAPVIGVLEYLEYGWPNLGMTMALIIFGTMFILTDYYVAYERGVEK